MMRAILWKESREQRFPSIILTLLSIPILVFVGPLFNVTAGEQEVRVVLAGFFAWACGMVAGAILLANECESGTQALLDIMPKWRRQVFTAKSCFGLMLVLVQSLLLVATCLIVRPATEPVLFAETFFGLIYAGLLGLGCGLFGSSLGRHVLAAVGWSIVGFFGPFLCIAAGFYVILLLINLIAGTMDSASRKSDMFADVMILLPVLAAGVFPYLSARWIYTGIDIKRRQSARFQGVGQGVARRLRAIWGMKSALWLSVRQGWGFHVGLLVAALVSLPFLLVDPIMLWPVSSLLLGVLAGVSVLADEQTWGSFRLLGEQRLPLGRFWAWKTGSRLVFVVLIAALQLGVAYLILVGFDALFEQGHQQRRLDRLSNVDQLLLHNMGPKFLYVWLIYGFCFGHLAGLLARKTIVALAIGLSTAAMAVSIWVPSLYSGGLPGWQMLAIPVSFLIAARFFLWPWATDRLFTRRMLPRWLAVGLGTLLWIAGCLAYRVLEAPAAPPPFDVAAFNATYPKSEKNKARDLILQACSRVPEKSPDSNKPWGGLPPFVSPVVNFDTKVWLVPSLGWPKDDTEFGAQLDSLAQANWTEPVLELLDEPFGMLDDRNATVFDPQPRALYQLGRLVRLLPARALQLQSRGDHATSLRLLIAELTLARTEMNHASVQWYRDGNFVESLALQGLERWCEDPKVPPGLLRTAVSEVQRHENDRPLLADAVKADYLMMRRTIANPLALYPTRSDQPQGWSGKEMLLMSISITSWEKARRERLLNALYSYRIRAVEGGDQSLRMRVRILAKPGTVKRPAGSAIDWIVRVADDPNELQSREQLFQLIDRDSILSRSAMWGYAAMELPELTARCRIRSTQLRLALLLHQHKAGRPANALFELVQAGIINQLPIDPFSGESFHYRLSAGEALDWKPNDNEKQSKDWIHVPVGGAGMASGAAMAGGMGSMAGGPVSGMSAPSTELSQGVGIAAGGALAAKHPQFVPGQFELKRWAPPGAGILWSVGRSGVDNGGTHQGNYAPNNTTFGSDIITLVPKIVR